MFNKKVLIAGAGKSGISAAGLLLRNGAQVTIFDQNEKLDVEALLKNFNRKDKVNVVIGGLSDDIINDTELFIISPGISTEAEFVQRVYDKNIPVWSEIELASVFNKGRIAAITGTNGKTTTTSLVGEIFKSFNDDTLVVGNIGLPFTKFADSTSENTLVALEVSSFQLETIDCFRPHVSAVLNLTPDHQDRHHTLDNYYNAKLRVAENQTKDDYLVANYDDEETRKRVSKIENTQLIWFSKTFEPEKGAFAKDGIIYIKDAGKAVEVMPVDELQILGDHNLENALAAVAITYFMGVPVETIHSAVAAFKGVEHRIEFVRELDGVKYYNDSKGTNPDAAIKALKAMKSATILIGGGYDKKSAYDEWVECFAGKVKRLILIGKTADDIEKCCKLHGFNDIERAETLEEAVQLCYKYAKPGENVLLSPACASWDMFKSYEQRGELFKEYVNKL